MGLFFSMLMASAARADRRRREAAEERPPEPMTVTLDGGRVEVRFTVVPPAEVRDQLVAARFVEVVPGVWRGTAGALLDQVCGDRRPG